MRPNQAIRRRQFKGAPKLAIATVLAAALTAAMPTFANDDIKALRQQIELLSKRLEQIENQQKQTPASAKGAAPAAGGTTTGVPAEDLAARVEDVERSVATLQKPSKLQQAVEGITVGGSVMMTAQQANSSTLSPASQLSTRADLEIEVPLANLGQTSALFFGHLRSGSGEGLTTGAGNFTNVNATAASWSHSPVLMQAFVQLDHPLDMGNGEMDGLQVNIGRIDPFGLFDGNNVADDESEGFTNLGFVHNPLLDDGGDMSPGTYAPAGVRLAYITDINGTNHFTASIGTFASGSGADFAGAFNKPFTIGQLEYSGRTIGNYEGAYRLYSWRNGQGGYDEDNASAASKRAGWGLSLDQQVSSHTTLFARYGKSTETGTRAFDKALTVGAGVTGLHWGRSADMIGFAAGKLSASSGSGSEKLYEVFYKWMPSEQIQVTPHVQRISNPSGDSSLKDITITGIRTKVSF